MLEHVAIWTRNLEEMKDFYCIFFGGTAGEKYESTSDFHQSFESYFLTFGEGSRLELMQMGSIPDGINKDGYESMGLTHVAFALDTREEVENLTLRARHGGYVVVLEPHQTGDGYYEACILDPDGNRVEVTVLP